MTTVVTEVVTVFLFVLHVAYIMVFLAFATDRPNPFLVFFFLWSLVVALVILFNSKEIRDA